MDTSSERIGAFLFPDALIRPYTLSGAAYLYFDGPVLATSPAGLVTKGGLELLGLVERHRPVWSDQLAGLLERYSVLSRMFERTVEALAPLRDVGALAVTYLAHPAGSKEMEKAGELLSHLGLGPAAQLSLVDIDTACADLLRHIFVEQYLALGEDLEQLYAYLDGALACGTASDLLCRAYFLRLRHLELFEGEAARLLVSNDRLVEVLDASSLAPPAADVSRPSETLDVVAWEFFRQILSRYADPVTEERAGVLATIRDQRREETKALRRRCMELALEVEEQLSVWAIVDRVEYAISAKVEQEVADLLAMGRKGVRKYLAGVFSNETIWATVLASVVGLLTGTAFLTGAGAVGAAAALGARAVHQKTQDGRQIAASPYALVYHMQRE